MGGIFGGKDKSAQRAAEQARQAEAKRQANLATGRTNINNALSGFDDNYFNTQAQNYDDWALPQLDDQFSKQKQKLVFALSRGGLLNSSSAAQKQAELNDEYNTAKQNLVAKGQDYATNSRKDVEDTRARLLSILSSTEDPTTVGDEAVRSAATLRQAPSFDPLGSLFTDIADQVSKVQSAKNLAAAYNSGGAQIYNSGSRGSGRTVNT